MQNFLLCYKSLYCGKNLQVWWRIEGSEAHLVRKNRYKVRKSAIGGWERWSKVDRTFNQLRFAKRPTSNSQKIINFILSIVTAAWYDSSEFAKHSPATCISF